MKWFKKRPDLTSLWEADGDLKRMKAFFYTIEADSEGNEQIKQSVKQKALAKMAGEEGGGLSVTGKSGLVQRIQAKLIVLSGIKRWKIGVSIIGLAVLVVIGQGVMNPSWNIFPHASKSVKSTQSMDIASQATGSKEKGELADQKSAFSNSSATPSSQGTSIAPPLATDEAVIPPTDAVIPRKITHNLTLTLEVATINDAVGKINREVQQQGGYVAESQQNGSDSQASAQITLKIPADKLSGLRDSLATWGKVLDQHMLANDITNQYYDAQARLQTLEAEEKRYLEILNQAKTVDDVLKVENALGNIRQQIEQLKGQLKLWSNQVDYSTVNLSLVTLQSLNVSVKNPWQPISWSQTWQASQDAVLKTISSSWNLLNYLVVGLGYALPYLLIGVMGWGGYRMWRKRKS
ncbi:MAG TPA: DUF4349 domain-containing protein [Desulfosporosinus sp.]|nr:DUF4349 domain-containing protein [Desulfosporosinus sp.]